MYQQQRHTPTGTLTLVMVQQRGQATIHPKCPFSPAFFGFLLPGRSTRAVQHSPNKPFNASRKNRTPWNSSHLRKRTLFSSCVSIISCIGWYTGRVLLINLDCPAPLSLAKINLPNSFNCRQMLFMACCCPRACITCPA